MQPRNVRLAGVALMLGALMGFLLTVAELSASNVFYPAIVGMAPYSGALGVWFLLDATALASGRRRHQRAILWTFGVAALAVGILVTYMLRGGV